MKLTHNWETQSGLKVTATCELVLSETSFADGWNVEVDVCKQNFNVTVKGMGSVGTYINRSSQEMGGVVYPATCGKLVISQENLDAIDEMITEIESHPSWIAKEEKEAKNRKESAEYEAHRAKMAKAMGY
jgi:glutamate dehydrogenase/leucine dehydrogenase